MSLERKVMWSLLSVLIVGCLVTTLAIAGESKQWRKPLVMAMGFLLTVLALVGVIQTGVCK